jgi:hypothetical protein
VTTTAIERKRRPLPDLPGLTEGRGGLPPRDIVAWSSQVGMSAPDEARI